MKFGLWRFIKEMWELHEDDTDPPLLIRKKERSNLRYIVDKDAYGEPAVIPVTILSRTEKYVSFRRLALEPMSKAEAEPNGRPFFEYYDDAKKACVELADGYYAIAKRHLATAYKLKPSRINTVSDYL